MHLQNPPPPELQPKGSAGEVQLSPQLIAATKKYLQVGVAASSRGPRRTRLPCVLVLMSSDIRGCYVRYTYAAEEAAGHVRSERKLRQPHNSAERSTGCERHNERQRSRRYIESRMPRGSAWGRCALLRFADALFLRCVRRADIPVANRAYSYVRAAEEGFRILVRSSPTQFVNSYLPALSKDVGCYIVQYTY